MVRRRNKQLDQLHDYTPPDPDKIPRPLRYWAGKMVTVNGWYICKETGRWLAYVVEGDCLVPEDQLQPFGEMP